MKPCLVVGLGNPVMGDDGVGFAVAEILADDPRLPGDVEVFLAGSDLLRCAAHLEGRRRIVVVDAVESSQPVGTVTVFDFAPGVLEERQEHAHHLSLAQSIGLLGLLTQAPITVVAVAVEGARAGSVMTPALAARIPRIVEEVLRVCAGPYPPSVL